MTKSLLFLIASVLVRPALAQTGLSNAAPSSTQNFDDMGTGQVLPANWRMHASTTAPSWGSASTSLTQHGSSGSPTAGGTYNWGSTASERAAGAMSSGSFPSPSTLLAYFNNTGSTNITALAVSYEAERYRRNSAVASIAFHYSADGNTWTPVPAGDIANTSFPTGTSAYTFASPLVVAVGPFSITGLSVAPGSPMYLRWSINTTGTNSQGIGVDDVSVSATFTTNGSSTGCSSSQSPYLIPVDASATIRSLLTTGDQISGYKLAGNPDGLAAFDNGNGTFTLLANHELGPSEGIARSHGSTGAFISKWVIDKSSLCVLSGQDQVQSVRLWNGSGFTTGTTGFNRFCSADLPAQSAFYNAANGKGTLERIFMNGEEGGVEGRGFAHILTGAEAGVSYQLPYLGRFNWENAIVSPVASDKTVVVGTDDAAPGQVYIYIGTKQSTGTDIEKAGLHNGHVFGVAVSGLTAEGTGSFPAPGTPFSLADLGDVHNLTGAQLNTNSNSAGVTNFLRPEDGAWDPTQPNDFYFNTTGAFTWPSRLWKLHFTDPLQPEAGGTITAVLDGTEGQKMLDNLTIDGNGRILLQEDAGNNAHNSKVWRYDIATDALTLIAQHDPARFINGGAAFLTENEESSGILDVSSIMGPGNYLFTDMAHYATTTELVEGGQLLLLNTGENVSVTVRAFLEGPYDSGTGTMSDGLRASGLLPLTEPYTALGYTFTAGDAGTTNAAVVANTDPANAVVDWVIVELRSTANSSNIVASRSALLQRDGDVVGVTGTGPVSFVVPNGTYHVALRHRNHLGVMTASPVTLSTLPATVDLTSATTAMYGTDARKSLGAVQVLWAGDVTFNGQVKYGGTGNDRDPILTTVGGTTPNNTVLQYSTGDVNMNGLVKYAGTGNDRDPVLVNVGSTTPNGVRTEQLP